MQTRFDDLNLFNNPSIDKMLEKNGEENEIVNYSRNVTKINRKGKEQTRTLLITNKAVYNLLPKKYSKYKRRIPLKDIVQVTVSTSSDEFVLHVPGEYDYNFKSEDKGNIVKVIKKVRKKLIGDPPAVALSDEDNLCNSVLKKPELKEDLSLERCSDVLLQPYKSYQTPKGRVIQLPSKRRSRAKKSLRNLKLRNDESVSSLPALDLDPVAKYSVRLDDCQVKSHQTPTGRVIHFPSKQRSSAKMSLRNLQLRNDESVSSLTALDLDTVARTSLRLDNFQLSAPVPSSNPGKKEKKSHRIVF